MMFTVWPGYQPMLVSFRESTHHTIGHRLKSSPHALTVDDLDDWK
jgi:hypothetical protein